MEVTLNYGRTGLKVQLPADRVAGVARLRRLPPVPDPGAAVADALRRPIGVGTPPLAEIARRRKRAVIAVSDITRPVPNALRERYVFLKPGQGARMVRSAGASAQLVAREDGRALLRLPSGELRRVPETCRATIGSVSNATHQNQSSGKAGRSRWLGKRPSVRGTAMNPVDHPHGGGEGKNKGSHPVTPWGKITLGRRTRDPKKASSRDIVRGRKRGKGRS